MKIAVFSDLHLGFGLNTELENDSFDNAEEAMEKALDSDLILIAGDIFDSRSPKTMVWAKAISILTKVLQKRSGVKLVTATRELSVAHNRLLEAVPIVALHGNHDRRPKNEMNAAQALDKAGLLIYLDQQTIVFEKDGIKVAIHGMSSVAERFAKSALELWNPKPIEGCRNILLIHQSIDPYVYSPLEPPSLKIEDLPKGFDLIVNGHIHVQVVEKIGDTTFLIPGSTTITQLEKRESEIPKGIFFVYIEGDIRIEFVPLQNTRKFFYKEVRTNNDIHFRDQVRQTINNILSSENFTKRPIIKIKIFGKENEIIDQDLRSLEREFSDKAYLIFSKELETPELTEKIEFMRNLREQRLSIEEIGLNLLRRNLEELNFKQSFDYNSLFSLLATNAVDKAFLILTGEQKTLAVG
jgi:DNA repair exonuclease SbcCD nuclease subunit